MCRIHFKRASAVSSCSLGSCGCASSSARRSSYVAQAVFALLLPDVFSWVVILSAAADSQLFAASAVVSPLLGRRRLLLLLLLLPPQPPRKGCLFWKMRAVGVVGVVVAVVVEVVADFAAVVAVVAVLVDVAVVGAFVVAATDLAERRPPPLQ